MQTERCRQSQNKEGMWEDDFDPWEANWELDGLEWDVATALTLASLPHWPPLGHEMPDARVIESRALALRRESFEPTEALLLACQPWPERFPVLHRFLSHERGAG